MIRNTTKRPCGEMAGCGIRTGKDGTRKHLSARNIQGMVRAGQKLEETSCWEIPLSLK